MVGQARALGLLLGYGADLAFGDPTRAHPVAAFGRVARAGEAAMYADSRVRGAAYSALAVGAAASLGILAQRAARHRPVAEVAVVALATWTVLGGRSLVREAGAMTELLESNDVPGARHRLSHLCSRDAAELAADQLARAAVESVAENTSDAVVAPLLFGAVAGVPGLLGYRAANTLDAMVGYRSERYQRFGWASARLDDVANWVPARAAAALACLWAPVVGGQPRAARRVWSRDARGHPSPNAGRVEGAFAGALGVRLGGSNVYAGEREDRGVLDGGRAVEVPDLARAACLSSAVAACSAGMAAMVALAWGAVAARRRAGG